jgi:hypothetical protein
MLVSFVAYSATLKMEAVCSCEISVDFHRNTWRYIPKDRTLPNNGWENLNSYKIEKVTYFIQFVLQYTYNSRITVQLQQLRHVSSNIFGHHQVVLIQPISTLSPLPHPLANVYNWGRSYCCLQCRFLVIDSNKCCNLHKPLSYCFEGHELLVFANLVLKSANLP